MDIKQQISSSPQTNDNYINSSLQKMTLVETIAPDKEESEPSTVFIEEIPRGRKHGFQCPWSPGQVTSMSIFIYNLAICIIQG
jgi:hypothetical protein